MCELNYRGTKIEIGVKLGDQKYNFRYTKMKPLHGTIQTLTRGGQRLNQAFRTNFAVIYKTGGSNLKLEIN